LLCGGEKEPKAGSRHWPPKRKKRVESRKMFLGREKRSSSTSFWQGGGKPIPEKKGCSSRSLGKKRGRGSWRRPAEWGGGYAVPRGQRGGVGVEKWNRGVFSQPEKRGGWVSERKKERRRKRISMLVGWRPEGVSGRPPSRPQPGEERGGRREKKNPPLATNPTKRKKSRSRGKGMCGSDQPDRRKRANVIALERECRARACQHRRNSPPHPYLKGDTKSPWSCAQKRRAKALLLLFLMKKKEALRALSGEKGDVIVIMFLEGKEGEKRKAGLSTHEKKRGYVLQALRSPGRPDHCVYEKRGRKSLPPNKKRG